LRQKSLVCNKAHVSLFSLIVQLHMPVLLQAATFNAARIGFIRQTEQITRTIHT